MKNDKKNYEFNGREIYAVSVALLAKFGIPLVKTYVLP